MFLIPSSYFEIRKTNSKGRGVFALQDIEPGTVIGDYLGKIMPTERAVKTEPTGVYYMEITNTHSVLADKLTDGIHLINHSCASNCGSDDHEGHALYVALRKIFKGEELTADYFFGPPSHATCNPCRHICHCGSLFCRGTMHTPQNKERSIQNNYSATDRSFSIEIKKLSGNILSPLSSYPKSIPNSSFFDLFGYTKLKPSIRNDTVIPKISSLRNTIRNTGLTIAFPKLGMVVLGVRDDVILSKHL